MKTTYNGNRYDIEHEHGHATATHLPGTQEVLHIANAYVHYRYRGQGLGDKYHKERLAEFISDEKTNLLTCIVNMNNEPQVKILRKNGWKFLHEFKGLYSEKLCLCVRDVATQPYDPQQEPDDNDDA